MKKRTLFGDKYGGMRLKYEKKSPGLPIEGERRKTGETKAWR
jgi:hypothetical protein